MSGKQYSAFDDEEIIVESVQDDEVVAEFLSDGESADDWDEEIFPVAEQVPYDHAKHMEALNEKEKASLEECHEAIKDKLKWAETFVPPAENPGFPSQTVRPIGKTGKPRTTPSCKFGKGRPMAINVAIGSGGIAFMRPVSNRPCKFILENKKCPWGDNCRFSHDVKPVEIRQPPQQAREKSHIVCKFILADQECPWGDRCYFSHVIDKRASDRPAAVPATPRLQKTRLCQSIVTKVVCKYGAACVFAHSREELRKAITPCPMGDKCNRVRKQSDGTYINVSQRICTHGHQGEKLKNFVDRTSKKPT